MGGRGGGMTKKNYYQTTLFIIQHCPSLTVIAIQCQKESSGFSKLLDLRGWNLKMHWDLLKIVWGVGKVIQRFRKKLKHMEAYCTNWQHWHSDVIISYTMGKFH